MIFDGLARALEAHPEWSTALTRHALLAARLLPIALVTPLLGLSRVSPSLRITATLALVVGAAPAATLAEGASLGAGALLAETLAGALFSLVASLPLIALAMGGRLVDQVRGATHPGEPDLVEGEPSSALGHLGAVAGLALFFGLGGHRVAVRAIAGGLEAVPLGAARVSPEALQGFVGLSAEALAFGLALALPAVAAVLSVELFLGLLARAAPTLPVFHAGMPLRALAGLAAVALALGLWISAAEGAIGHAMARAIAGLSAGR